MHQFLPFVLQFECLGNSPLFISFLFKWLENVGILILKRLKGGLNAAALWWNPVDGVLFSYGVFKIKGNKASIPHPCFNINSDLI